MAQRKVVVLMNDLLFKTKIQDVLKQGGFEALWSSTAEDALAKIEKESPSLLILDLGLKSVDTLGVIEKTKRTGDTNTVPVLAYTSHVDRESWKGAVAAGADKVVARSEFSSDLANLVRTYASSS
jgi:DNA-binding response OmpR family regulator